MRFTADYDSEEEAYPVNDKNNEKNATEIAYVDSLSDDDDDLDYIFSVQYSPRANRDAWVAMYNRDKEIYRLKALNEETATNDLRNSLILEDLEAVSVADYLKQLNLDDEGRRKVDEEETTKKNVDVLQAITKAIDITKQREEEKRRKAEEEERERVRKIEEERERRRKLEEQRRKEEQDKAQQEKLRQERIQALEKAKKAAEEEKAATAAAKAAEARRQEEQKKKELEASRAQKAPAEIVPEDQDPCKIEFEAYHDNIKSNVLKACSENPTWKKACFELKRKITARLGQLTNSRRQISRLVRDLIDVFEKGKAVDEMVLIWLLNFFSKQVVKQAESEVIVQIPSAYPLAFVCVFLMTKYLPLSEILVARFAKNSPWTVPYYDEPTTEEAMKRMGYKRTDDGKWEEQTRYIERQSGIFAVWAAMSTHELPKTQESPVHPFPVSYAWRWAARTLNHPARNEIECAMMATFLEVVNQKLLRVYGRQARKVISLAVSQQWIGQLRGPAVGRLEIMRDEFAKKGKIGDDDFGAFVP